MKNRGFTLIELTIVVVILGILFSVGAKAWQYHEKNQKGIQSQPDNSNRSTQENSVDNVYHAPAPTKVECVDGYKFVNGKQMLNTSGQGIYCN